MPENITNFPKQGDNKKISLSNSNYKQFDYDYMQDIKENYPKLWKAGGNIRGNEAFEYWAKAKDGDESEGVLNWIQEREAWAARHYRNKRKAGVVALGKWGVVGAIGKSAMKKLMDEEKQKESEGEKNLSNGVMKKIINFEIKQVGEESERVLRFAGSTEDVDRDEDIIRVAGWECEDYMKNPVFLWGHDYSMPPIGKCIKLEKDTVNKKLMFDIKFPTIEEISSDVENPAEHTKFIDMVYNMYKGGYLKATSVGFKGFEYKARDDAEAKKKPEYMRGREYTKQSLLELSAVPVPSNPNALEQAKSKGLIDDITIKSFSMSENKIADMEGNPSVYDIFREISRAIRSQNIYYDFYPEDLYPTQYPSGRVAIMAYINREYKVYMHDYTYEKVNGAVNITLGQGTEIQQQYAAKSIKSLFGIEEIKAGASISAKNMAIITEAIGHMGAAMEMLEEMIEPATEEPEGEDDKKADNAELKQLSDTVKSLQQELAQLKTATTTNKDEINLDDIEKFFNTEKNTAKNELGFQPEEFLEAFEKTLEAKLNKITGKI